MRVTSFRDSQRIQVILQPNPVPRLRPARESFLARPLADRIRQDLPVRILTGRTAILAQQPRLADLATRCGQAAEPDFLAHFLSTPDAVKKNPALLLIAPDGRHEHDLLGAALLFEYKTALGGSSVYASADATGRRNLIAPPDRRARLAAVATRALIRRGAQIVHLAFSETHHDGVEPGVLHLAPDSDHTIPPADAAPRGIASEFSSLATPERPFNWAFHQQTMRTYLPLLATFDETLARIGQRTRSNLRYYRRRCEQDLGCRFIPQVNITLEDFLAFNRRCTFAVPDRLAAQRFLALGTGTFFAGIQQGNGDWLALAGGRRHGSFVELDWQMNRADLPASSLSTVFRSFLIEHEVALGSTRLYIEGGTPQPIGRSFRSERIGELTVTARTAYASLLKRSAPLLFPARNYLAQTLKNPALTWHQS